jgi:hypothetical protein
VIIGAIIEFLNADTVEIAQDADGWSVAHVPAAGALRAPRRYCANVALEDVIQREFQGLDVASVLRLDTGD